MDSYRRDTLGKTDFRFFLKNYNKSCTKKDLNALITRYNHCEDGKVSYSEFCQELACNA